MTGVTSSQSNLASAPEDFRGLGNDLVFPECDGIDSMLDTAAGAIVNEYRESSELVSR